MLPPVGLDEIDVATSLAIGRRALAVEAEALWTLGQGLDRSFADAVDILRATSGRIAACGLGKSGHVARKVAGTLTATGSPAFFLHAAEAVHGDLGLLMKGDTLLILSNSGDTRELGAVVRYAETIGIPIVAITSSPASVVANGAEVSLILPPRPEVCAYDGAPTTSTTMMMALGDALAVTLMRCRNFSIEDMQRLHPGGRLGLDLTTVDRIMHRGDALPLVKPDVMMIDVLALITAKSLGIAGVVDSGDRLVGVITDGDIRRHAHQVTRATARMVMNSYPRTLTPDALARDALTLLSEARITALFIVDTLGSGKTVGVVHVHDLLRLGIG